jgi:electron transport complex protein RnfD
VGRLAVAVLFASSMNPPEWNLLAQDRLVIGDIQRCRHVEGYQQWQHRRAPQGADGFLLAPPGDVLAMLTSPDSPAFSAINYAPDDMPQAKPACLPQMPPINDLLYGAYPGESGATCAIVIVMAGLYLIYRNYVKWQLPVMFILSAACVAAVAPVFLAGPHQTVETIWWPVQAEGLDVGFIYVMYQLLGGELMLAAFFLATEMTSRPVTSGAQALFGVGCGSLAMLLQMYTPIAIPCYMAVLIMNTFTPVIDHLWRPRVLGRRRLSWLRK